MPKHRIDPVVFVDAVTQPKTPPTQLQAIGGVIKRVLVSGRLLQSDCVDIVLDRMLHRVQRLDICNKINELIGSGDVVRGGNDYLKKG